MKAFRKENKLKYLTKIEIKGLIINKPVFIFLKIHLGFEHIKDKFKYKLLFLKLKLNKSDDLIRISFDSLNLNLIKIKDITTIGLSTICGIKQKTEISNENLEKEIKFI